MQLGKWEKAIIQGFFTELGIFSSSDEAQCHIIFSLWTVSSGYKPLGIIKEKNSGTNTAKTIFSVIELT